MDVTRELAYSGMLATLDSSQFQTRGLDICFSLCACLFFFPTSLVGLSFFYHFVCIYLASVDVRYSIHFSIYLSHSLTLYFSLFVFIWIALYSKKCTQMAFVYSLGVYIECVESICLNKREMRSCLSKNEAEKKIEFAHTHNNSSTEKEKIMQQMYVVVVFESV